MASKNTKLPKAPGTDGLGNIKVQGGPAVLDLSDYDDLFGDSFGEAKKKSGWEEFKDGFTDSLSKRLNTKDVVRNFLRSAAPEGINSLFGTYDSLKGSISDIKDSLESTNASDLDYVARRAKDYLPKLKDYLPNNLYEEMNQGLENKIDDYQYAIQASKDQTAIRAANKAESENQVIKQALDQITLVSKQNFQHSERAEAIRDKANRVERGVRDVLQTRRFDYMAKTMGMMVDNISRVSAYQEQFDAGIKRKGLELQFRTYMGIKDLVKLAETSLQIQVQAAEQLVRNTGTPDYQKGKQSDLRKFQRQGQRVGGGFSGAMRSTANRTLQQYLGNFGSNVEQRVQSDLSGRLRDIVQAARMAEGGPGLWDMKYNMAGAMAGEFLGDGIQNTLIPMIGREFRPTTTKLMNKYGGGKHNQMAYLMDNLPAFAQEFVNNNQNQYGWKGKVREMLMPYIPQFGLQDKTTTSNYQTIDQQASFNQMTQRSIVEVIPGLLSRAVQELRMIRTGRDDVDREVFDMTNGRFVTEKTSQDNLLKRIIPDNAIRAASSTINDVLNQFDPDGKLSPEARKALGERLLRDSSYNKRFDPSQYIKSRGYADGTSAEVSDELGRFFRGQFSFDNKGNMEDNANNHQLRQEWSQAFLDIRSISRDPYKEIERLLESGNTEPLRLMGIVITENGIDKINYNRIWEILRSGITDGNPFAPGGDGNDPNRDDMSGTVGHKDFMGPAYMGAAGRMTHSLVRKGRERFGPAEKAARDAAAKRIRELRARYGNNAAAIAEALKNSGESLQGAYGKATDFTASLTANGFGGIPGQISSAYDKAMDKLKPANNGSYVPKGMDQLTDLYSQFNLQEPLIKGIDFVQGNLIDVNTRKVIEKPSDITGAVINTQGLTVATAREVAQGLVNGLGEKVVAPLKALTDKVSQAIAKHRGLNAGTPELGGDSPNVDSEEDDKKPVDLSLSPGGEPVITARGIENGEYFNRSTGRPIRTMDDLDGDIVDREGNVVVTAKEVKEGLYNYKTGKKWRLTRLGRLTAGAVKGAAKFSGMTATQIGFHAMKFMGKAALGIAARTFNFFVENQNAYLPDSQDPIFSRRDLLAGKYYMKNGKVVEDFVDVYDEIVDEMGVPILELSEYKNLKNYDGTKHQLAKNRSLMGRTVKRAMRAMRNAYIQKSKQYWKWLGRKTVSVGAWAGGKLLGGSAKVGGAIFNRFFEKIPDEDKANPTNIILAQILHTLQAQEPEKIREGSWQDKAKKKAAALGDKMQGKGMRDDGKQGMLGGLLAGLGKLMGGGKKKGDDEDEDDGFGLDDAADIADIADAAGDARERGRRRRGGRGGRPGSGGNGRLARMGKYALESRAGQWMAQQGGKLAASRMGVMAATTGARLLAPLATGVAALLSAPAWAVIAGVAVVGGAAYLGYRAYKASGEFKSLRMAQYGISSTGEKLKILKLETLLEKYTDKTETPQMNIAAAGGKAILDVMGIDIKNEPAVMVFSRWLETRFKPIYLAYIRTMASLKQQKVALVDIDDQVPDEMKYDLLQGIKFPYEGDTPYDKLDNPFDPDEKLEANIDDIRSEFKDLEEKYKSKSEDAKKKAESDKAVADLKAVGEKGDVAKTAAAATGAAVTAKGLAAKHKPEEPKAPEGVTRSIDKVKAAVKTAALSSAAGGTTMAASYEKVGKELTGLQSVRMRAYGIEMLALIDVESMLTLEWVYSKDLSYQDGAVDYMGDFQIFVREAGTYLGVSTEQGSDSRNQLVAWLTGRFAPAFRAFWTTAKNINPSIQLRDMESQLKITDKLKVANSIIGAYNLAGDSIWEVESVFKINGKLGDLRKLAEADVEAMRKLGEKEVAGTPTQKASDQVAGANNAAMGGSFADQVVAGAKSAWDNAKTTVSDAWNKTKSFFGGGDSSSESGGNGNLPMPEGDLQNTSGNTVTGEGTSFSNFEAKGNGGKWEDVPFPTANGTMKGCMATFKAAAALVGLPAELLFIISGLESGYDYKVRAKPSKNKRTGKMSKQSSAYGYFQFINDTWDYNYAIAIKKFGCPPDDAQRSMRLDPRLQAITGAIFIKSNYDMLGKVLSRPVTDTDIYIAHFLGPGGARKFLKADPNALGYQVFKEEYKSNITIFFVDGETSKPRTIAQIYKIFSDKIAQFRIGAGKDVTSGPQQAGKDGTAITQEQMEKAQAQATASKDDDKLLDGNPAAQDHAGQPDKKDQAATVSPGGEMRSTAPGVTGATPSSSGGSSSGQSGTTGPSQDSGGSQMESQRAATEEAAAQAQARRDQELRQSRAADAKVDDVQQKQLNTLLEIRDYLKEIASQATGPAANGQAAQGGSGGGQSTSNSMNPQQVRPRQAMNRPSPMSLT